MRQACPCPVDLTHISLCTIVGHGDYIGIERIGRYDVRSSLHILRMDLFQHIGTGDVQKVVIAFQLSGEISEPFPSIILLCQFIPLNHRAQPTVEH